MRLLRDGRGEHSNQFKQVFAEVIQSPSMRGSLTLKFKYYILYIVSYVDESNSTPYANASSSRLPSSFENRSTAVAQLISDQSSIAISEIGASAHLRSAARGHLTTPRTRTRRFSPRSFRVCGPAVWNSRPTTLQIQNCHWNISRLD